MHTHSPFGPGPEREARLLHVNMPSEQPVQQGAEKADPAAQLEGAQKKLEAKITKLDTKLQAHALQDLSANVRQKVQDVRTAVEARKKATIDNDQRLKDAVDSKLNEAMLAIRAAEEAVNTKEADAKNPYRMNVLAENGFRLGRRFEVPAGTPVAIHVEGFRERFGLAPGGSYVLSQGTFTLRKVSSGQKDTYIAISNYPFDLYINNKIYGRIESQAPQNAVWSHTQERYVDDTDASAVKEASEALAQVRNAEEAKRAQEQETLNAQLQAVEAQTENLLEQLGGPQQQNAVDALNAAIKNLFNPKAAKGIIQNTIEDPEKDISINSLTGKNGRQFKLEFADSGEVTVVDVTPKSKEAAPATPSTPAPALTPKASQETIRNTKAVLDKQDSLGGLTDAAIQLLSAKTGDTSLENLQKVLGPLQAELSHLPKVLALKLHNQDRIKHGQRLTTLQGLEQEIKEALAKAPERVKVPPVEVVAPIAPAQNPQQSQPEAPAPTTPTTPVPTPERVKVAPLEVKAPAQPQQGGARGIGGSDQESAPVLAPMEEPTVPEEKPVEPESPKPPASHTESEQQAVEPPLAEQQKEAQARAALSVLALNYDSNNESINAALNSKETQKHQRALILIQQELQALQKYEEQNPDHATSVNGRKKYLLDQKEKLEALLPPETTVAPSPPVEEPKQTPAPAPQPAPTPAPTSGPTPAAAPEVTRAAQETLAKIDDKLNALKTKYNLNPIMREEDNIEKASTAVQNLEKALLKLENESSETIAGLQKITINITKDIWDPGLKLNTLLWINHKLDDVAMKNMMKEEIEKMTKGKMTPPPAPQQAPTITPAPGIPSAPAQAPQQPQNRVTPPDPSTLENSPARPTMTGAIPPLDEALAPVATDPLAVNLRHLEKRYALKPIKVLDQDRQQQAFFTMHTLLDALYALKDQDEIMNALKKMQFVITDKTVSGLQPESEFHVNRTMNYDQLKKLIQEGVKQQNELNVVTEKLERISIDDSLKPILLKETDPKKATVAAQNLEDAVKRLREPGSDPTILDALREKTIMIVPEGSNSQFENSEIKIHHNLKPLAMAKMIREGIQREMGNSPELNIAAATEILEILHEDFDLKKNIDLYETDPRKAVDAARKLETILRTLQKEHPSAFSNLQYKKIAIVSEHDDVGPQYKNLFWINHKIKPQDMVNTLKQKADALSSHPRPYKNINGYPEAEYREIVRQMNALGEVSLMMHSNTDNRSVTKTTKKIGNAWKEGYEVSILLTPSRNIVTQFFYPAGEYGGWMQSDTNGFTRSTGYKIDLSKVAPDQKQAYNAMNQISDMLNKIGANDPQAIYSLHKAKRMMEKGKAVLEAPGLEHMAERREDNTWKVTTGRGAEAQVAYFRLANPGQWEWKGPSALDTWVPTGTKPWDETGPAAAARKLQNELAEKLAKL